MSRRRDHIPHLAGNSSGTPPPRPCPCCPPGAQMCMTGSDGPLSPLGCDVIFERAAIFESCWSCDQREESEVSLGFQVEGDMNYKCTG